MADFVGADLRGSRFERVDLGGAEFRAVGLAGARFRGADLSGAVLRGVELAGASIYGDIADLTVNGVQVGPLIDAELNRRYPDRERMRPADPAGWTCRGTRCPTPRACLATAPRGPRWRRCSSCEPTGWPPSARSSTA